MEDLIKWYEKHKTSARFMSESEEYNKILFLTSFLDNHYDKITIAQRMWHIINDNYELQKCKICAKLAQYKKQEKKYKVTCSQSCSKLYFVSDNYIKNQVINSFNCQEKIKNTCMERYGVENYSKTNEFKKKYKSTNIEKYGIDNYAKTQESKVKQKQTCIERYGKDWFQQTEGFKNNRKIMLEKILLDTGYELITHSIKSERDSGYNHYDHILKCPICKNKFKIENTVLHDRMESNHVICTNCNKTEGKYYSEGEKEVLDFIKSIYEGEIMENTRSIIYPYELDIYLSELKIAIEYNGDFWHMNPDFYHEDDICKGNGKLAKDIWRKDIEKIEMCDVENITLIIVWENEWKALKNNIKSKIKNIIDSVTKSRKD